MNVMKDFIKKDANRNSWTILQWLYWTKLFSPVTFEI